MSFPLLFAERSNRWFSQAVECLGAEAYVVDTSR